MSTRNRDIGIVLIGRNEGERLRCCLRSLHKTGFPQVYVDSGSSDGSVELARDFGCTVVELNMQQPFTAARARNAGMERLLKAHPGLDFMQFIDGDCQLDTGWLPAARARLESIPDLAIVCGRRREIQPRASIYNCLCDMEWNTPVGEAEACGGDFLARVSALRQVNGFDPSVVAGEEPEMCFRLRAAGWRIERMDREMTLHDAAMSRFRQFWQRARRSGHAYAQTAALHWQSGGRFQWRQAASILFWTVLLPLMVILSMPVAPWLAMLLMLGYPILWVKMFVQRIAKYQSGASDSVRYATFVLIGKFAQLSGIYEFVRLRLRSQTATIIEYK